MENDKDRLNKFEFIKYHLVISNFEKYIKDIYSNSNNYNKNEYEGFLIHLNDFKELKENINYNKI